MVPKFINGLAILTFGTRNTVPSHAAQRLEEDGIKWQVPAIVKVVTSSLRQ